MSLKAQVPPTPASKTLPTNTQTDATILAPPSQTIDCKRSQLSYAEAVRSSHPNGVKATIRPLNSGCSRGKSSLIPEVAAS
ncbi:hypothetical protein PtA15_4A580 [Puccinia triticina]|uniref:Uncharacterized protein n=1 Tax=Puccinia triticina TaxID=208348 RepID=A0ABY7CHI0_9BASI|nr:uncharacterized protein PtA15_4A580 [Puccinia triticina]WAQ84129.1 hypothetical protein PtA15_4A580 [Puccinia triticina]